MKKLILLLIVGIFTNLSVLAKQTSPDLILFNGKIFTSDATQPNAEAIAISGERILAIGSIEKIKNLAGAKTRLIDLQNRVVTPGFNDAHNHFSPDPKGFNLPFKSMEPSWNETIEALENAVRQAPRNQWIFGTVGGIVANETAANRQSLDRIAPNHLVMLRAYYGHSHIINSKAMRLLKIADTEADPMGGRFDRDAVTKKINGRLWEYAEWRQIQTLASLVSDEDAIKELKKMAGEAVNFGITSIQLMSSMRIDRFVRLLKKADLPIRVRAIPFALTTAQNRDLSEFRMLSKLKPRNSKITVGGIKWVLDGTPFERGAALRKDYYDRADWRGQLNFPESEVLKMIEESLAFKQQFLVHCAGDRCAETVFGQMEKASATTDWKNLRFRIEHGDGVISDLIPRARKLGVIVVQNPIHFTEPELFPRRWGKEMQPLRSLIEAGVPVAFGSDGPMNPFLNIMLAAIHPARPTEAISREQAVRAYTFGSAYAEFTETEKGTLKAGKLADLTVLSQNIFTMPVPDLPKTQSILTIVGGKIVHDAKVLK